MGKANGPIDVVSPGTVAEIERTLGVRPAQVRRVIRAFKSVGIEI